MTAHVWFPKPPGRVIDGDALGYYAWLRSVVFDGDINFSNDYRLLTDELAEDSEELTPLATGLVPNKWPPGSALLWAPLFLAVTAIVGVMKMRFSSGTSRWWVAAYLAVTLVCTTGWLILSQRLAEQTGLRRQVWLVNDFQGTPVINDVAREPDARLSGRRPAAATRVHQRPVARVLVRSEPSVVHTAC